jgi:hypothetical protein
MMIIIEKDKMYNNFRDAFCMIRVCNETRNQKKNSYTLCCGNPNVSLSASNALE